MSSAAEAAYPEILVRNFGKRLSKSRPEAGTSKTVRWPRCRRVARPSVNTAGAAKSHAPIPTPLDLDQSGKPAWRSTFVA
jgi:hypothetical protein